MAEIVNLRAARKARSRAADKALADANAAIFGRSKAQKALEAQEALRARQALDARRREVEGDQD